MNSVFVYCEIEEGAVADVSLELLTKGRSLATLLGVKLEAVALGSNLEGIEKQLFPYGADVAWVGDDARLSPYATLPHAKILARLFEEQKPQVALMGATSVGRDLGPRVSSALHSGLTADCTSLEIGDYTDPKSKQVYKNLLYQIRPAFGGNIVATIVNPDCRPQMATVREGVMKKEILDAAHPGEVKRLRVDDYLDDADLVVKVIERHVEKSKVNIKGASIIVAGGYGVGSRENFNLLHELASILGGEVGASRAAVDAGFAEHERQVGQTGTTVRPKLYIACGISGQIQHTAGMEESAIVIAINTDPAAPINKFADYVITGDLNTVIPKMIQYYKKNSK
ncbi:MAG: electron transfer flavoprotein subunit alpha/FixB family protein [Odoribacteraceae bacterium]|jgi:electron transfer flavoprotein alpha subunit|nr:electron transfer flavoprotein subunit alpha/FixB family protein [Odoribacteraceae bacterium]